MGNKNSEVTGKAQVELMTLWPGKAGSNRHLTLQAAIPDYRRSASELFRCLPRCTIMRLHPRCARGLWVSPVPRLPLCSIRYQSSSSDNDNDRPRNPRRARDNHRRSAQTLETRQVELGVHFLGEPGSVTLVKSNRPDSPRRRARPVKKFKPSKKTTAADHDHAPQTVVDSLLDDLDEEASTVTKSDVHEAIENLGRSFGQGARLLAHEWDTLRSRISTSFTNNQLADYLTTREPVMSEKEKREDAWRPGTSSFWHASLVRNSSNTDRVAATNGLTGKSLLAERILRDCWQLSVASEVGQLDLRLSPVAMTVLLNSTHFSFDEVAGLHGSIIDVTSSLGLVRATGEQDSCEAIRDVIQDAVARIREEDAGISCETTVALNQVFTRPFIDWVCETYGVAIKQDSSSIPNKILYLAESFRDAEDARRTLNFALSEASQPPVPFSTYMPASEPANLYGQALQYPSWLEGSKSWFRWATSSTQTTSTETQRAPIFDGHQTRLSDELLKHLRKDSAVNEKTPHGATVHETITAAVGRCLFSSKQTRADAETTLSASQLGRASMTRTFTSEVPNITPFMESFSQPKSKSGTASIRLKPSSEFSGIVPELEVEFIHHQSELSEDSGHNVEITSLKSILETSSVDYLLPENAIDLRFTRTVYRKVTDEMLGKSPHYRQLIRNIEQSLVRDIASSTPADPREPIPLPPFCKISLPRGLLLCPEEELHGDNLWDAQLQNNIEVEYMYPPLSDVRSAAVQYFDLDGRELSYRFYESGPFLAKRTTQVALAVDIPQVDAALHPDPDEFQRSVEHRYHEFYTAACDMAFKVKSAKREDENQ